MIVGNRSSSSEYSLTPELKRYLRKLVQSEQDYMDESQLGQTDPHLWATRVLSGDVSVDSMLGYFEEYYPGPDGYPYIIERIKELSN